MKYDHNKSYGYPILRPNVGLPSEDNDYPNYFFEPSFSPSISLEKPDLIEIEVDSFLNEPTLKIAVIEKRAKLSLLVFCRETYFSKSYDVAIEGTTVHIKGEDLHGKVELSLFVIAIKDFTLSSENFHSDFDGEKFDIVNGNILAQSQTQEIFMQKEYFRNAKSIISMIEDDTLNDGEYIVSVEDHYIEVSMNSKLNAKINGLLQSKSKEPVYALNAIFVPAVTYALSELSKREDLIENKWAQVLSAQLNVLKNEGKIRDEFYNQAQSLFKKPLTKISVEG